MSNPKKQLEEILNQEEYQAYYVEQESVFQQVIESIGKWLSNLFHSLFPNAEINSPQVEGLLYFIGIIGLGLLVFLLFRMKKSVTSYSDYASTKPMKDAESKEWKYEDHMRAAAQLKSDGKTTEAARHVFLAMLLYFEERGWLTVQIWKTNGDYYQELRKINLALAEDFQGLAILFDRVTYGKQTLSEAEYDNYYTQARQWMGQTLLDRMDEEGER